MGIPNGVPPSPYTGKGGKRDFFYTVRKIISLVTMHQCNSTKVVSRTVFNYIKDDSISVIVKMGIVTSVPCLEDVGTSLTSKCYMQTTSIYR
jgi:hypothetical protein